MALGRALAGRLFPGSIICLYGDLGSGKTTFVKGLAQGLKIDPDSVHSPTFVLLNVYEGKPPLYHFDFYRLQHPEEMAQIGYDEFLYGDGVAVVEWSERFGGNLPREHLKAELSVQGQYARKIVFSGRGERYGGIVTALKKAWPARTGRGSGQKFVRTGKGR